MKAGSFLLFAMLGAMLVTVPSAALGEWIGLGEEFMVRPLVLIPALTLALIDMRILRIELPERDHQVDRNVILRHPWKGTIPYGFALGTGFWTHIGVGLPYFVLFVVSFLGDPHLAVICAVSFAAGRTAPIVVAASVPRFSAESFARWTLETVPPIARQISAVVILSLGISLLVP